MQILISINILFVIDNVLQLKEITAIVIVTVNSVLTGLTITCMNNKEFNCQFMIPLVQINANGFHFRVI